MGNERLAALLAAEAREIGVVLTAAQIAAFLRYRALIARWNSRARLTALADPVEVIRLHFVDSLLCLIAAPLASAVTLIDVGSGAGLPGIPLAIARPHFRVTLLEPAARKAAFLERAVAELGLPCAVVAERAEVAGRAPQLREQFDAAVARAVAPLATLVEWTLPFVRVGGSAVLLKGPAVDIEMTRAAETAPSLGGGTPALLRARLAGGQRRAVVVIPKRSPTPPIYPRQGSRRCG